MSSAELDELAFAARCLEGGGFTARLAERLGRGVESGATYRRRCAVWSAAPPNTHSGPPLPWR
jgi:hypothetical protein